MSDADMIIFLSIAGLGVVLFIVGILSRIGSLRWVYAMKGHVVLTPSRFVLVFIPIGIMTFFLGILPFLPVEKSTRGDLVFFILFPLLIIIYGLAIWSPWWLKPKWLRWLEKEHGDIIYILWEDVRRDRWAWERRVKTQEGLEAWVAEVRERNNL